MNLLPESNRTLIRFTFVLYLSHERETLKKVRLKQILRNLLSGHGRQ